MHTIKYKNCLAQQDNKTLCVIVSKKDTQAICYPHIKKLSGKELRTVANQYLSDVKEMKVS